MGLINFEVNEIVVKCARWIKEKIDQREFNKAHIELAKKALGINFKIEASDISEKYRIAHAPITRDGKPRGTRYIGDDRAILAIASLDLKRAMKKGNFELFDNQMSSDSNENFFTVGSAVSNAHARALFDYIPADRGFLEYKGRLVDFPIRLDCSETLRSGGERGYIGIPKDNKFHTFGKHSEHKVPNWSIVDHLYNHRYPEIMHPAGFVTKDYLLITRIPNFTSSTAYDQNKSIVIVGGTHTEGTVAIEKLLNNKKLLVKVGKMLYDQEVYKYILQGQKFGLQMLFEVHIDYNSPSATAKIKHQAVDICDAPVVFNVNNISWDTALKEYGKLYDKASSI